MLSKSKEKIIKQLHTQKGREKNQLCLVEGVKNIELAKNHIEYTFTEEDSENYKSLVTTSTPQKLAAVAKIPEWSIDQVKDFKTIIVLDHIQDPGNLGTIFRNCLAFDASLILIDCVDPTNPKVIRSSTGSIFQVPWIRISRNKTDEILTELDRPIFRLESSESKKSIHLNQANIQDNIICIAGSEGKGILLDTKGTSIEIPHNPKLESLNVSHAVSIFLSFKYSTNLK